MSHNGAISYSITNIKLPSIHHSNPYQEQKVSLNHDNDMKNPDSPRKKQAVKKKKKDAKSGTADPDFSSTKLGDTTARPCPSISFSEIRVPKVDR